MLLLFNSTVVMFLGANVALGAAVDHSTTSNGFDLKPFTVDLSSNATRMKTLVANTILPSKPEYPGLGNTLGIDLDILKSLQNTWTSNYTWATREKEFNQHKQFTATIEGLRIHFVYEKSGKADAIPLILNHGWPETFQDFVPLIPSLKSVSTTPAGKNVSFDVIIPSLPGFAFSSAPPANWTTNDTARVFNILMTEVLGYKTYSVFGTDWGCVVGFSMYSTYTASVRALALDYLPFFSPSLDELAAENITLDAFGQIAYEMNVKTFAVGTGYYIEQNTEPNTIGLALYDSPMGQLAWIANKILLWSDPPNGSVISPERILDTVSLYFLTNSFLSSVFTFAQNPNGFMSTYYKANTDAPLLFSVFQNNNQYWQGATGNV